MEETVKIKVVNNLTGEITEVDISNPEQAKDLYLELNASARATDIAKRKIMAYLDEWLGQDEEYKFKDGKRLRRVQRSSKVWTIQGLKAAGLDEDAINTLLVVNMPMAKAIVKEMAERGEIAPNAGKLLDESADVKASKPFMELR